jgi:hypothetical protein
MKFLTALAALLLASPAFAQSDKEMQDRIQIENLMWRYVRALDTFNADAYAATFTPDGQFGSGPTATKGRDALKKMIQGLANPPADKSGKAPAPRAPMYHVITQPHMEFLDKDHVHYEAYWTTTFGAVGQTPARVAAAGREVDELVRVNGQWLIKLRDVAPRD